LPWSALKMNVACSGGAISMLSRYYWKVFVPMILLKTFWTDQALKFCYNKAVPTNFETFTIIQIVSKWTRFWWLGICLAGGNSIHEFDGCASFEKRSPFIVFPNSGSATSSVLRGR
jgi:hypothetical protein